MVFGPTQDSPSAPGQTIGALHAPQSAAICATLALGARSNAQSVQYVKICSLYGAGFYYMPGTDTCIKVGGFVRAEMNFNSAGSFNPFKVATLDSRGLDQETTRVRGVVTFDARSQTEYGTLRSYMQIGEQVTNDDGGSGV
ncbi:MAG TPA: porin, partial [Bradyrhizobium sp.]